MANPHAVTPSLYASSHAPCVACGYDLFGCDDAGQCPECGLSVADSRGPLRIVLDPRQTRQLLMSLNAWGIAIGACSAWWFLFLVLAVLTALQRRPVSSDAAELMFFTMFVPPMIHGFTTLWTVTLMPLKQVWPTATLLYRVSHWTYGLACFLAPLFSGVAWGYYLLSDRWSWHHGWDVLLLGLGMVIWIVSSLIAGGGMARLLGHMAQALLMWPQLRATRIVWWALSPQILCTGLVIILLEVTDVLDGGLLLVLISCSIIGIIAAWLYLLTHLFIIRDRVAKLAKESRGKLRTGRT